MSAMKRVWYGELGKLMKLHLEMRKAMGRVGEADMSALYGLNHFMHKNYPKARIINRMILLDFLRSKKKLSIAGRRNCVIHIRQFCRFLNQRGIACYIPDRSITPKYRYRPRYYPLTEDLVLKFMRAARDIRPNKPFIGETYATVLGILWSTGMRRREAVNLNHEDVDLETGVLVIRQTKFFKDRMIPISKSAVKALKDYSDIKEKYGYRITKTSAFFINLEGARLPGHTVMTVVKRVSKKLSLKKVEGRLPAVHDFRHNFATQAMEKILKDPETYPPGIFMPRLSIYLGHINIFHTQYYLHPDFNLMLSAANKFGLKK